MRRLCNFLIVSEDLKKNYKTYEVPRIRKVQKSYLEDARDSEDFKDLERREIKYDAIFQYKEWLINWQFNLMSPSFRFLHRYFFSYL